MLNILFSNPLQFFLSLISLFVALTVHEFAHAWTADRLGDPTPRMQGRVSLNPKKHIDFYGLLFLILAGFGWGKPVQFDPFNLKDPRRDGAIISLAGPVSNLLFALSLSLILRLFILIHNPILTLIGIFFIPLIYVSVTLGIFNLIPIYPLDGFHIVEGVLPENLSHDWLSLKRYGIIFLILLLIPLGSTSMLDGILNPILSFIIPFFIPQLGGSGVM